MFKKNIKFFAVCGVILSSTLGFSNGMAQSPKYPQVLEIQGSVWTLLEASPKAGVKGDTKGSLKIKEILREKAHLVTGPMAHLQIQLDEVRAFILMPESELSIPAISWESGEVPVLNLKRGSLHWLQDIKTASPYNTALTSQLFQFIAPAGDYLISIDPSKAIAALKVFEGKMVFAALNSEESINVKSKEQVEFIGEIEDSEISYDILLKGKRIPKGKLSKIMPLDQQELTLFEKAAKEKKSHQDKQNRKKQALEAKIKSKGIICRDPMAKFNQCAWTCVSKIKNKKGTCTPQKNATTSCIRQRCNANGIWAERTELTLEQGALKCKQQVTIEGCDY